LRRAVREALISFSIVPSLRDARYGSQAQPRRHFNAHHSHPDAVSLVTCITKYVNLNTAWPESAEIPVAGGDARKAAG
jgi:hypothetical protein